MLFTGYGDSGYTSVIGGPSLLKCDVRLEALGALDEAQAHLGLARALLAGNSPSESLRRVQSDLHLLMADCATVPLSPISGSYLTDEHVRHLEADIACWEEAMGGFRGLMIPGDTVLGAHLHIARTAIRRAERQVVALQQDGGISGPAILTYLNRLSSWVYALAVIAESDTPLPSGRSRADRI